VVCDERKEEGCVCVRESREREREREKWRRLGEKDGGDNQSVAKAQKEEK